MSFPASLQAFKAGLTAYQRPYIKIEATPIHTPLNNDPLSLKQSKFMGFPFLPAGMDYPKDVEGQPLVLAAQINFSETPDLEGFPSDGVLQFFISPTDWYSMEGEVRYLPAAALTGPFQTDFSFLTAELMSDLPFRRTHRLAFETAMDYGSRSDAQFDFLFDGKEIWEFYDGLDESEQKAIDSFFNSSGHKLGGYGMFAQEDPRATNGDYKEAIQLLQIDMDDYIMFGDCGIAHLFVSKEELAAKQFDQAFFYWDCY